MTDDDDIGGAKIDGLVRLAKWLGINVDYRPRENIGAYRWRIGRAIQREEKRLRRMPKEKKS